MPLPFSQAMPAACTARNIQHSRRRHRITPHSRGLTLLELLMIIVLIGVLTSTALPAMANLLRQQESLTIANNLLGTLILARNQAISLNQPVTLCADATAGCGDDWANGVTVFIDSNSNAQHEESETIIARMPALKAGSTVKLSNFGNHRWFRYLPDGRLDNYAAGNIVYCPPDGDVHQARTAIISRNGRPRLGTDSNHDGIYENSSGKPLSCS